MEDAGLEYPGVMDWEQPADINKQESNSDMMDDYDHQHMVYNFKSSEDVMSSEIDPISKFSKSKPQAESSSSSSSDS